MGMLLRFSARTPRSVPTPPASGRDDAKVLLFTGVRYERETATGTDGQARRKPGTGKGQTER